MSAPSPSDVKLRYPEFTSTSDDVVGMVIGDAFPFFDEERWGSFYLQGYCAFVAHQLTVNARAAAGAAAASGPVQTKTVGDVSVTYQGGETLRATDSYFATTSYGQRYLQLRRLVGAGALAV